MANGTEHGVNAKKLNTQRLLDTMAKEIDRIKAGLSEKNDNHSRGNTLNFDGYVICRAVTVDANSKSDLK